VRGVWQDGGGVCTDTYDAEPLVDGTVAGWTVDGAREDLDLVVRVRMKGGWHRRQEPGKAAINQSNGPGKYVG
jgi:hypothetical protein